MENVEHKGIISLFARHGVAANLLMTLMIIFGIWGLTKLNTQIFPSFELDLISIRVVWTGASAEDIQNSITVPIESEIKTIAFIKRFNSNSTEGIASITVELEEDAFMFNIFHGVSG